MRQYRGWLVSQLGEDLPGDGYEWMATKGDDLLLEPSLRYLKAAIDRKEVGAS